MLAPAFEICQRALSEGIRPDPAMTISTWAEERRYVPSETSARPGKWSNTVAPHLVEIMECLSPSHPCNRVTLIKSAQVGGTEVILNALGFIADIAPGPTMVVHPTLNAGKAWSKEKLDPNIEGNPVLRDKFREDKSGKETGCFKKFSGGFLVITGANSTADLRQKSIKYLFKDDWDDWPLDLGEQGDPDKMANARQISYHDVGTYKCCEISTPTLKSISRSHKAYFDESDRRVREICCPTCGHWQELRFFPLEKETGRGGLKFNTEGPLNSYYVCEKNGCVIEHHQKDLILDGARWRATNSGEGKHPGFKINALYSKTTTWDRMAAAFLDSKDQPRELKTFWNLWLGEAWEERGDAPDWKRLMLLREDYALGRIPAGGLVLTLGADVQADGVYFDVEAWGVGLTRWSVDYGFVAGDTARDEVWRDFAKVLKRRYTNAWGQDFGIDFAAIDANYHTHKVHAFVRVTPKIMAIRGVFGAGAPILGAPAKQDLKFDGKRKSRSLQVWPVGTWQAKSEFYACLRLEGIKEGQSENPLGYIHFSQNHDENYFKQITAESLVTHQRAGARKTEWVSSGPNHLLDCKVYSRAAAEHLGVARWSTEEWIALAKVRNVPRETMQGDLLALTTELKARPEPEAQATPSASGVNGEGLPSSSGDLMSLPSSPPEDVPSPPPASQPPPQPPKAPFSGRRRVRRFGI